MVTLLVYHVKRFSASFRNSFHILVSCRFSFPGCVSWLRFLSRFQAFSTCRPFLFFRFVSVALFVCWFLKHPAAVTLFCGCAVPFPSMARRQPSPQRGSHSRRVWRSCHGVRIPGRAHTLMEQSALYGVRSTPGACTYMRRGVPYVCVARA